MSYTKVDLKELADWYYHERGATHRVKITRLHGKVLKKPIFTYTNEDTRGVGFSVAPFVGTGGGTFTYLHSTTDTWDVIVEALYL